MAKKKKQRLPFAGVRIPIPRPDHSFGSARDYDRKQDEDAIEEGLEEYENEEEF